MAQLANDSYGRNVNVETSNGQDVYTVTDPNTQATFTLSFKTGWPQGIVYQVINSMPENAPVPSTNQIYTQVIQNAIAFSQQLMVQFAVSNLLLGITQSGQTQAVINYTAGLAQCLNSGSLYAAMAQINTMIADTSSAKTSLSPFITNAVLYGFLNQIQNYLGIAQTPNPGP